MRPLPTRDDLLALLREPLPDHDPDPDARKLAYREALKKRQSARAGAHGAGYPHRTSPAPRQGQAAFRLMRTAPCATPILFLHSEFAYVMGIEPNEVPKFIAKELGNKKQPALRFEARAAFYGRVGRGIAPCVALRLPSPTNRKAEV